MRPDPAQPLLGPSHRPKAGDDAASVAPDTTAETHSAWRLINAPFLSLIWLYRFALGPWMGGHCRFHPSCSTYALEAFRTRNTFRALWLTTRRLARCHPWGGSGFDPVPLAPATRPKPKP